MSDNNNELTPQHIAIIMDGNGRWAKNKGLKRTAGHEQGMKNIDRVARKAGNLGVKAVTFFAFSTENWKRPVSEVNYIMNLPARFFNDYMPEIRENNIKITMTGFTERIPKNTLKIIEDAIEETKDKDGIIMNFALNYGGRLEIVEASKRIAEDIEKGKLKSKNVDEALFDSHLMSSESLAPYQNIDLMIRTSGEERLSNFMLWQNAYSEFYFSDLYWPDFDEEALVEAIEEYKNRNRRFGAI